MPTCYYTEHFESISLCLWEQKSWTGLFSWLCVRELSTCRLLQTWKPMYSIGLWGWRLSANKPCCRRKGFKRTLLPRVQEEWGIGHCKYYCIVYRGGCCFHCWWSQPERHMILQGKDHMLLVVSLCSSFILYFSVSVIQSDTCSSCYCLFQLQIAGSRGRSLGPATKRPLRTRIRVICAERPLAPHLVYPIECSNTRAPLPAY